MQLNENIRLKTTTDQQRKDISSYQLPNIITKNKRTLFNDKLTLLVCWGGLDQLLPFKCDKHIFTFRGTFGLSLGIEHVLPVCVVIIWKQRVLAYTTNRTAGHHSETTKSLRPLSKLVCMNFKWVWFFRHCDCCVSWMESPRSSKRRLSLFL